MERGPPVASQGRSDHRMLRSSLNLSFVLALACTFPAEAHAAGQPFPSPPFRRGSHRR